MLFLSPVTENMTSLDVMTKYWGNCHRMWMELGEVSE